MIAIIARATGKISNAINDNKGSKSVVEEESSCCCWLGKITEKSGSYWKEELKWGISNIRASRPGSV